MAAAPPPPPPDMPTQLKSVATPLPDAVSPHPAMDTSSSDFNTNSESDSSNKVKPKPPSRNCTISLFKSHHIEEPAQSLWFNTRFLLVFRLAATAILLSHLVFFSLRQDFNYQQFTVWNYAGLTLSLFLVLMCSLLSILREEDDETADDDLPALQGEPIITDLEQQPITTPAQPQPKLAIFLNRISVPLYQIFVTATIFGAALYWISIFDSSTTKISYPLLMLVAAAPVIALIDFVLSMSIRFRLVYIVLYAAYNALYALASWLLIRLGKSPIYLFFDRSTMDKSMFIARVAGVAAASIASAFLIYFVSLIPLLSCLSAQHNVADHKSVEDSDRSPKSSLDDDVSARLNKVGENDDDDVDDDGEFAVVVGDEDELDFNVTGPSKRRIDSHDRRSLPILSSNSLATSTSGRWFRSPSARLAASASGSSLGEEARDLARTDSNRSNWDNLEALAAKKEDEFFAMPKVYAEVGKERDVVKLQAMPRVDSGRSGMLSRSGSARMSRSGSERMSRSGSGRMSRSGSGRMSRTGSGRFFSRPEAQPLSRNVSQKSLPHT